MTKITNTRRSVVVIGAGLGGSYLAAELVHTCDVTIVDLGNSKPLLRDRIVDLNRPATTYPTVDSGWGGTTRSWHNALMEISDEVFARKWPFSKKVMKPYYEQAYLALAGVEREIVKKSAVALSDRLAKIGFPRSLLSNDMYIPIKRQNAWLALELEKKVKRIEGEVIELSVDEIGQIGAVAIKKRDGRIERVGGEIFVLAAGGLGTPVILQKLAQSTCLSSLCNAGLHYEDHPMAVVAEVTLNKPLYKLWNYPLTEKKVRANIRIPFSILGGNLDVSFQLRPAHHIRLSKPRNDILTIVSDLRNFPWRIKNYWKLLTHTDDLLEILSFKFGLRVPTKRYSVLMVAEQPPSAGVAVFGNDDGLNISRCWEFDSSYICSLRKTVFQFLEEISDVVEEFKVIQDWDEKIYSSSHHSGTAKMSSSATTGVCDPSGRVYGIENLYVCDASLIPGSGYVNTGLTIVALAKRLGHHLKKGFELKEGFEARLGDTPSSALD